ncbi:MAG: hypothetical protein R6W88_02325 [Desulfobacterales bacterium]
MEDFVVTCASIPMFYRGSSRMYHTSDPVDVYPATGGVRRPASMDCRRSRTLSGGLPEACPDTFIGDPTSQ